ncbi:MAG: CheB methylesterase [Sphingobacteriaceae bacterium]|jgi:two-component system chemotaxis response regulator CheB|nr:CheB methylesterase [Sphingobacteriaceae bacterium]
MEKTALIGLVVIGGSAGSLDIILNTVSFLRSKNCPPVIIVIHRKNSDDSSLADLLAGRTQLKLKEAGEKDRLKPDSVYLAPADYHLLVEKDHTLSLDFSEKVNYSRPSIDVTFQTAAEAFGEKCFCILLSGASADGAEGLQLVNKMKGITAVQDPSNAEVAFMPQQAIDRFQPDYIVDTTDPKALANLINSLTAK